ncbi:glycosyltransferase family 2 protein [Emticicia sp. BO119]|uniref:glycosyltransferase family 2 protein n=1 Tax=Emticicia sp. BO119 TaxID=2757768 RepID=UPI0015F0D110|nr:glycosyltransferase family 2 protein [Emticicia sp. BO119]MBA4853025.1 glycosyltransferase family 2 protein [Emticicia sp. BO119]
MPLNEKKLLIIIPCFNEEVSIAQLLTELLSLKLPYRLCIAVVNDCSTDNSLSVIQPFNIVVLNLPVNLGIGGAMQTGYKYASRHNYDLAVQMDGDGQHPPSQLAKLLDHYKKTNANIVIGSRFISKEGFQSSFLRRSGIAYFHRLNQLFTGKRILDITSGFRLFDEKAIRIAANSYPDEYPEPESLVAFAKAGLTIDEIAVVMKERQGGQSSISSFSGIYYMIKVSIAMFFAYIRK